GMTDTEYRTHMSLWSMLAAPLIAGNDLRSMTQEIHDILTNKDVIAIDQDPDGHQANRVAKNGDLQIWSRPLARGATAVALFNRATADAPITVKWSDFGFRSAAKKARDLWSHSDVKVGKTDYTATVPGHGVVLLRLSKK